MTNANRDIEGGCLCGAVRYHIRGEILGFQYCHCSRCRRFTGSAHAANLFTRVANLDWLQGEDSVGTYTLPAESDFPPFPTAFCRTCGSAAPSMSSTGKFWVIPAGTVDGDPGLRPQRAIFWGSRACWYTEESGLPRHDTLPTD